MPQDIPQPEPQSKPRDTNSRVADLIVNSAKNLTYNPALHYSVLPPQPPKKDMISRVADMIVGGLSTTVDYVRNNVNVNVLVAAMAQVESGGKQVKGASGEFGALQFMPGTWRAISTSTMGKVLPQTPENEYAVALAKVKDLAAKGWSAKDIGMIWNTSLAGQEKPLVKKGAKMIRGKKVIYDSEAHGKKVEAEYKRLMAAAALTQ